MRTSYRLTLAVAIIILAIMGHMPAWGTQESQRTLHTIYFSTFASPMYHFYAIRDDGSEQQMLAKSYSNWFRPSFSGNQVAFTVYRSGPIMEGEYDLYVKDLVQGNTIQLTHTGHTYAPMWSPSDDMLAFAIRQGDKTQLAVLQVADGERSKQVLYEAEFVGDIAWLADSSGLLFRACVVDMPCDVYSITVDGSGLTLLTKEFPGDVLSMAWSPETHHVAFAACSECNAELDKTDIYLLDVRTGGITKLTDTSARYEHLSWSPTGEQLALASDRDGDWDVYVMDVGKRLLSNLTNDSVMHDGLYGLDWSPDGRRVVFSSGPYGGDDELFIVAVDGTQRIRLTNNTLHDIRPLWLH